MEKQTFSFRGFRSLQEYESECARAGYATRRVPFHKNGFPCFVLIVSPPKTATSVEAWTLFPADESAPLLSGVINGYDSNYLGKLADNGYYPADTAPAPLPAAEPSLSVDDCGQYQFLF